MNCKKEEFKSFSSFLQYHIWDFFNKTFWSFPLKNHENMMFRGNVYIKEFFNAIKFILKNII